MLAINRLRVVLTFVLMAALALGSLSARTRKGEKLLKQGQSAEDAKDYDKALDLYDRALHEDPSDAAYQLAARRIRYADGNLHLQIGEKLREQGKLEEALGEFQKAFSIDSSSAIALQEIKQTNDMIERVRRGMGNVEDRALTPSELGHKQSEERIASMMPVPELKPITGQISALKMNGQPPKVMYETVGKLAGVNVIFDPQFQSSSGKNANLDLSNSTLEDALNYIALLTHTFWKPVTSNTIFVADDNPTKRRDYEDQVVRVFYLKNITTPQEFQEIVTGVRSLTDIRRMFTYAAQNAIMARGTVDQIALAEKLFHDLDKPKPEVVVDIIVLNANRSRTRDIAMGLVSGGKTGLTLPIGFTPRNTLQVPSTASTAGAGTAAAAATTSTGPILLSKIGKVGLPDFSLSLPGALLQALMTDSTTRVLQSPQVRASDGMKVSLKIGQKYPYASGSFQPGIGSVGVSPLVSTQFQFADVGVNVEITPHVHGTDEVTMHVSIDISAIDSTLDLGGLSQPVIGQKKNETDLRVRDGEVTMMGGLLSTQDSQAFSGIPGFVNIPVLGKFFMGSNTKSVERGELLIALIPHIVRSTNLTPMDMEGIGAGTDQQVHVNFAHKRDATPVSPAAPVAPAPAPVTVPQTTAPATPAAVPSGPKLVFSPMLAQPKLGAPFVVTLQVEGTTDLFAAPVKIKWDPKSLRLEQAAPGPLLTADGQKVNAPLDIRNDAGEATVNLTRLPGAPGVNGNGSLLVYTFTAIGKGPGTITVSESGLTNSKKEALTVAPAELPFSVE